MLHLSYINLAEPRGPLGLLLDMSSARKEGHLMWPSSCAGLPEQAIKYNAGGHAALSGSGRDTPDWVI